MKSISNSISTIASFIFVMFSIVLLNVISAFMLLKLAKKKEVKPVNDSYIFEGFELCFS